MSLVKECRCLNEREVTARSFLLPPAEPITARWGPGDLMSKLSPKLRQNSARSWTATGVSIQTNTAIRPARYLKVCAGSPVPSVPAAPCTVLRATERHTCTDETSVNLEDEYNCRKSCGSTPGRSSRLSLALEPPTTASVGTKGSSPAGKSASA